MTRTRFLGFMWRLVVSLLVMAAGTTSAQDAVASGLGHSNTGRRPIRHNSRLPSLPPGLNAKLCSDALLCQGVCREACNLQVFMQQVMFAVNGTPPGADISTLASKMYSPNAVQIVTPIAAFANGMVAFEYILTFSRQPAPNVPPPVVTLKSLEVQDIIVSGSTVTNTFDLLLASPFDPSKTATLRGWSMTAFNEVSMITYETIIYPLWEEVMTTLGLVDAYANASIAAYVADQVCTAHEQFCAQAGSSNQQYDSKEACIAFMLDLPPPPVHRLAGNNLFCRLFHARYVDLFPAEHCPHIGPTGGGQCTEELPFTMQKLKAMLPRPAFYSVNPLLQANINKTAHF